MRIGLALDKFDPRRGGAEQWTMQFVTQLLERGHEVHVVARQFGPQIARLPLTAHCLSGTRSRVGFAKAAEAKLRSLSADVVHDLGWGWHCDIFQPRGGSWTANAEQKLLRLPRWSRAWKRTINRLLPRHRDFQKLFARQYADHGQVVVALSQMVAADFQRFHGVAPERIRVIYNGVDTTRFSPSRCEEHRQKVRRQLAVDDDTMVLLITAHNFALKGVPTLLRATGRLAARGIPVHLVVVGGRHAVRRDAAKRNAAVTFVGPVDDPVPYYAAADMYVHPTLYDSFALAVLEAAACGLPVITSRFAGVAELLTEGVDGHVLYDPADVDELTDRLQPFLSARSLCRGMGKAARQMALKHTFQRNVDEILALYEEVHGTPAGGSKSRRFDSGGHGGAKPHTTSCVVRK